MQRRQEGNEGCGPHKDAHPPRQSTLSEPEKQRQDTSAEISAVDDETPHNTNLPPPQLPHSSSSLSTGAKLEDTKHETSVDMVVDPDEKQSASAVRSSTDRIAKRGGHEEADSRCSTRDDSVGDGSDGSEGSVQTDHSIEDDDNDDNDEMTNKRKATTGGSGKSKTTRKKSRTKRSSGAQRRTHNPSRLDTASAATVAAVSSLNSESDSDDDGEVRFVYRDFSRVTPSTIFATSAGFRSPTGQSKLSVQKLPAKLNAMLSCKEFESIISWMPHGRAWKIHKPHAFVEQVIPRFFEYANYNSFIRLVNAWGFRRLLKGPDRNAYYHEVRNGKANQTNPAI